MKKILIFSLVTIFLALDFAALDDITTGNEPNYFLEYLVLGLSVVVFAVIFLKRKKIY